MKIKQHKFLAGLGVILTALTLSGCVTQEFVYGVDNKITERVIDSENAAMARLKLAIEYLRQNQISAAKQNLDRAAAINDQIDGIASSYAFYYQRVGEVEKADRAYRKALRQFPENSEIRNNYGAFLCDLKRYEQAYNQFVRAIDTESNNQVARSHENAGLCALRDKNWLIAQKHLSAVLKYQPNQARATLGVAKASLELNNLIDARSHLARYNQRYVQTPQSLWVQIQIENKAQNYPMVEGLGKILLREYPNSQAARHYGSTDFR